MKVVYFNTLFYPTVVGGAERSLKNLISALKEYCDIEPVVITLNPKNIDVVEYIDGIKIYRLAYRNTRFVFGDKGRFGVVKKLFWHFNDAKNIFFSGVIRKILMDENPELVHTNNLLGFSAEPIAIAHELNIPLVHTIRDYYFQCWRSSRYGKSGDCGDLCFSCKLLSSRRRYLSNFVDAVVGNSKYILDEHLQGGVFSRARVKSNIYNIFEAGVEVKPKEFVGDRKFRVGYLGRLAESKGVRQLVDIFSENERYDLLVAGEGEVKEYVIQASQLKENIRYLGFVKPADFFPQIDVLVIPSLWREPLPRTAYEAYSYGVPVIGSNAGGTYEVITENETGYVFDVNEFSQILKHVNHLSSSPIDYHLMSRNCIEYSRNFSGKAIAGEYYRIYESVL